MSFICRLTGTPPKKTGDFHALSFYESGISRMSVMCHRYFVPSDREDGT
jgi:hypothetical protein